MLKRTPGLIGRKIKISVDPRDIRFVRAYAESGQELGILRCSSPWHLTPHTLEMRQEIRRLERNRKLRKVKAPDPSSSIWIISRNKLQMGALFPFPTSSCVGRSLNGTKRIRARADLGWQAKAAIEVITGSGVSQFYR
jgi:hypothetical protein